LSTVTPQLSDVYTALRTFLQSIVGQSVEVVQGLGNRVPMPVTPGAVTPGFIAMTAIMSRRLSTNADSYTDPFLNGGYTFTGTASAAGNILTVLAVATGTVHIGDLIGGANVPYQSFVTALISGTGGVGTYQLSTLGGFASTAISVTNGVKSSEQDTQVDVQIDAYGPSAADWTAMISTLFRDEYGVNMMAPNCAPLYIDNGTQAPLTDAEQQYEQRFVMSGAIMYTPVTVTGQQFAGALEVTAINVKQAYKA